MDVPIFVVDAFADRPFEGNPAAVCLLDAPAGEDWMRRVAREMNLSETAFLHPEPDAWHLRWFTPAAEVDLCGHATLAAAHVLREERPRIGADLPLRFRTRSGILSARPADSGLSLDFPAVPAKRDRPPDALLDSLAGAGPALEPVAAARNRMDWLVELADEQAVGELTPDFRALADVDARGVIVTAPAGPMARAASPDADFVSRFFGPAVGVDEDPVTGSAHCALGPWWAARLGRESVVGRQLSARGGTVRVRCRGDRVDLEGRAVTVLRGAIRSDAGTKGGAG